MNINYSPWFAPQPEARLRVPAAQVAADKKLIISTCFEAILNCPDPAVRWQAARLLQRIGPVEEVPHA